MKDENARMIPKGPGRRDVLAAGLGLAAAASAAPSAAAEKLVADVIVIGGGLAGVTAARDLSLAGFTTLLVEARGRLGGKTVAATLAGRRIDAGGTWFHWHQAAIWREVLRYELDVVERPLPARYLIGDGSKLVAAPADALDARLRGALAKFWGDPSFPEALPRPFEVLASPEAFRRLDATSVEARLRALALDPADDAALRAIFSDFGRPLDRISLGWALQRVANGVWSYESFMALFAVYRLAGGMAALIDAMIGEGAPEVRLSSPVAAIGHDALGVTVRLGDGTALAARAAVVATPVEIWKTLAFSPALPEAHLRASRDGMAAPRLSNFLMHARGIPGVVNSFAPYGTEPFDFTFTYEELGEREQIIAGYSMSGEVRPALGRAAIEAALRRVAPGAELIDFVATDWDADPFALGGNGALSPGQLGHIADVLDKPVGRLFFAGSDIAPQFPGFLTGAIESGARAARRAAESLRRSG